MIVGGSLRTGRSWWCFVFLNPLKVAGGDAVEGCGRERPPAGRSSKFRR